MAMDSTAYYERNVRGDLRLALGLANEVRCRVVMRLFGVRRDQSWAVTLIALGLLLGAAHDGRERLRARRPHPMSGDAVLGAFAADEIMHLLGGPGSRQVRQFAALTALALVAAATGPTVSRSVHGVTASGRRVRAAVRHHYGRRLPAARPATG